MDKQSILKEVGALIASDTNPRLAALCMMLSCGGDTFASHAEAAALCGVSRQTLSKRINAWRLFLSDKRDIPHAPMIKEAEGVNKERTGINPTAVYTTGEAAALICCQPSTIQTAVRTGRIRAKGRPFRILGSELLKLV